MLEFIEGPAHPRLGEDEPATPYVRYYSYQDIRGTDELQSVYGVYREELATAEDESLGINGYEFIVRVIPTDEVLAESRYFVNRSTRKICGHVEDGILSDRRFVQRALNLESPPAP